MSAREKAFVERLAKMPPALQDKFLDKADGAIMALDAMTATNGAATKEDTDHARDSN